MKFKNFKNLSKEEKYKWYKANKTQIFDLMWNLLGISNQEETINELNKLLSVSGYYIDKKDFL